MAQQSEDLVSVAAGTKARVAGWSKLLRAECIELVIDPPCEEHLEDEPDYFELWVHRDDARRAALILQICADDGGPW